MASSTAGPCDVGWAAAARPHPLAPCRARLSVHLTPAIFCKELPAIYWARRPAPAAGPVLHGLGNRTSWARAERAHLWQALQLPFLLLETSASAAALALPTCACTVPRADPVWLHSLGGGCPHRASPTLLPVPAAPSCKAGGDFLLQGRNTSITDTLDRKGTGASEQGGAIKGMPHPPPEPAQRSLGGGEWPPVLHEGLMRGGQPGGGFPRKHRALRLSPPAQAVTRLDGSCSLAPSVQFPVPWGHAAHRTMACPVQLTC